MLHHHDWISELIRRTEPMTKIGLAVALALALWVGNSEHKRSAEHWEVASEAAATATKDGSSTAAQATPGTQMLVTPRDISPKPGAPVTLIEITKNDKPIVTVLSDGSVIYGKGYTPDAAAKAFWEETAREYPSVCEAASSKEKPDNAGH